MNAKKRKRDFEDGIKNTDSLNTDGVAEDTDTLTSEPDSSFADSDEYNTVMDAESVADAGAEGDRNDGVPHDPYAEIERLRDQYLRLNADFDNYRKRTLRDKQDWSRYASQSMMEKLLGVIDNFDAAASSMTSAKQDAKSLAEGFLMIHKQLTDILSQEGLAEIPALGEQFDPNVHEAVMTVSPGKGQKENEVALVMRKGYMFKDKVLRPSMVQVAKDI